MEINQSSTKTTKAFEHVAIAQVEKVLYTGKTHTTGGRDGASKSSDGKLDVKLSSPGSSGSGTNPEQLFAAGWSACFIGAIRFAANKFNIRLSGSETVDAEVDLCNNAGGYFLQARLHVTLAGLSPEEASALVNEAHQTCPYSKATRGNINVTINVVNNI